MLSLARRGRLFRRRPPGAPDRAFRRGRVWFALTYVAPVFVTVMGLIAAGGALADGDRDGRWITIGVGLVVSAAGAGLWWRHHQPLYEFFGTELWKGRRLLADLADVEVATVYSWRFGTPNSPLIGVLVIVGLVRRDDAGTTRLFGPSRLDFDEQRAFHDHLVSHGVPIEGDWLTGRPGDVIEGTRRRRRRSRRSV